MACAVLFAIMYTCIYRSKCRYLIPSAALQESIFKASEAHKFWQKKALLESQPSIAMAADLLTKLAKQHLVMTAAEALKFAADGPSPELESRRFVR